MGTRNGASVGLVVVCGVLLSCSRTASSPTAPSVTSGTRLNLYALVSNLKVGFKDKYGNTGSVSGTFGNPACLGCWDY
jgi:hypothetical protein